MMLRVGIGVFVYEGAEEADPKFELRRQWA